VNYEKKQKGVLIKKHRVCLKKWYYNVATIGD